MGADTCALSPVVLGARSSLDQTPILAFIRLNQGGSHLLHWGIATRPLLSDVTVLGWPDFVMRG